MSWSPTSIPNSDFDHKGSNLYSPQLNERQVKHASPASYPPNIPRVIDDAEFCSLPNRTPVSCSICGKLSPPLALISGSPYFSTSGSITNCGDTCLRFNVSKHQQVQMMEAAQILVDMVNTPPQPSYSPAISSKSSDNEPFSQ
ncbi:hypothetical protein L0F63_006238 [Massospora cicadina]|nr:hypothetical protein L0F63_006238 [Massospora cicadina]